MPLFGYKCNNCGKVFEILVLGGTAEEVSCPECGAEDVTKLISSFATGGSDSKSNSCGSRYFS
jgi:putative FmdB family regulatory protein